MLILTVLFLATIAGLTMWFISHPLLLAYGIGTMFGLVLFLSTIRVLSKNARHSTIALELFAWSTGYKASRPSTVKVAQPKLDDDGDSEEDYDNVIAILTKQMKFPLTKAEEATIHAMAVAKGKPIEEKTREALKYLGSLLEVE